MVAILRHPVVILLISVAVLVFLFSLDKTSDQRTLSAAYIEEQEKEIAKLLAQTEALEAEAVESSSEVVKEKIIRNELLMQKDGEYSVMLPDLEVGEVEEAAGAASQKTDSSEKSSPWAKWRELLVAQSIY